MMSTTESNYKCNSTKNGNRTSLLFHFLTDKRTTWHWQWQLADLLFLGGQANYIKILSPMQQLPTTIKPFCMTGATFFSEGAKTFLFPGDAKRKTTRYIRKLPLVSLHTGTNAAKRSTHTVINKNQNTTPHHELR